MRGATVWVRMVPWRVASASVLPWHSSLHRAKAAELSYLDAWAAYLDSVAQGGDTGTIPTAALATKRTDA